VAAVSSWTGYAARRISSRSTNPNGETTVTETLKVTYKQDWLAYNAAQSEEKSRFMLLLSDFTLTSHALLPP
jgi:hypothetical protein